MLSSERRVRIPGEWTETHEPWHEEIINRGNRLTKVNVLGRETKVLDGFRLEILYVRGLRVDLGFEVQRPLSGMRETMVLQPVKLFSPKSSPTGQLEQVLKPELKAVVEREMVAVILQSAH